MSSIDYKELRRIAPLSALLDLVGWERWEWHGDQCRGECLVCHRGARVRPPFAVDLQAGAWYCHRCKRGGGCLDLAAALWSLPIYEAARELCGRLGVPVPYLPRSRGPGRGVRSPRNRGEEP